MTTSTSTRASIPACLETGPACRRAEAAEARAWADLFSHVPGSVARRLGLELLELGGATALVCAETANPLFNRVIGLGVERTATDSDIDQVVRAYRDRGIARFFVHRAPGARPEDLADRLAARGLPPYRRSWVHLVRRAGDPLPGLPEPSTLAVRPAGPGDRTLFGALLATGFDLPPAAGDVWSSVLDRPDRWCGLVAVDGDTPVAAAAMYLDGHHAYLAGAATAPAHRRRGGQGLLLRARVRHAEALGARTLSTETGEAVPGDAQHPYRNLCRHGFAPVGVRPNHAPEGWVWDHGTKAEAAGRRPAEPESTKR